MTTDAKPIAPPVKPRTAKRGLNISAPQVLLVLGMVVALSVIINFSSRIQAEQRISAEANRLRAEVTAMAATQAAQATELAYYQSDAYVMEWAHSEGRLVQPGEVLVVPIPGAEAKPTPQPEPTAPPVTETNLEIWWDLFFAGSS
jgi:cell division protein FtsB